MSTEPRVKFNLGRLLMCEGPDDVCFLAALIQKRNLPLFHLMHTGSSRSMSGGNSRFGARLKVLRDFNPSFNNLNHVVLVTDADDDPNQSFQSVVAQLAQTGFSAPAQPYQRPSGGRPAISIALVPAAGEGSLESICAQAGLRSGGMIPSAVDGFVAAVHADKWPERQRGKLWTRAFIAAKCQRDPCINLGSVFEDWKRDEIIPLSDAVFDPIANFLESFR